MRTVLLFCCCLLATEAFSQDVMKITPGTVVSFHNSALFCLNNMNLENDAPINMSFGDALFYFTGPNNNSIQGSGALSIDRLVISKASGSILQLQKNINIQQAISFGLGLLDLNGKVIHLSPGAIMATENNASHLIGDSGYVEVTQVLNAPNAVNPGNLGARITSSSNLGTTIVRRGHTSQTNASGMGKSIQRYFDIIPANNNNLNASLRLYYLESELNGFMEHQIYFWKSTNFTHWTFEGFGARSTSGNYVEKSGINSFARFTLSTMNNALPLNFLAFHVLCGNGNSMQFQWKTANEVNVKEFIVQGSTNGTLWNNLSTLAATGNAQSEEEYSVELTGASQYLYFRIMALDLDGKTQFTNVLKKDCASADLFRVWPNPFRDHITINLAMNESVMAQFELINAKGQLVKRFQENLNNGMNSIRLSLADLSTGVYTLRISNSKGLMKSVQLVK